jgi:MoaA/NifB/PqqE/SkfB family radical SAM enzyme
MQEEEEIFRRADALGEKLGVQVDMVQYAMFTGTARRLFKTFKGLLHQRGRYCPKPYDYFYINVVGDVTPCCSLPRHRIGSLLKDDLRTIWNSSRFKEFRRNQNVICKGCDMIRIRQLDLEGDRDR